jgi:hypothetical protein
MDPYFISFATASDDLSGKKRAGSRWFGGEPADEQEGTLDTVSVAGNPPL